MCVSSWWIGTRGGGCRDEHIAQAGRGVGIDLAVDELATPAEMNQAGLRQRLDVMRQGRGGDVELCAELADTVRSGAVKRADCARRAAAQQALEDPQPVRIAERLEHSGLTGGLVSFIFRHISKCIRAFSAVKRL